MAMDVERRPRSGSTTFGGDGQPPWPRAPTQLPPLGAKVSFKINREESVGTVGFTGETLFGQGTWVGIVLDTPTGKNDGSVKGKRYFKCLPNHGLFIRPTSVSNIVDLPRPRGTIPSAAEEFAKRGVLARRSGQGSSTPSTDAPPASPRKSGKQRRSGPFESFALDSPPSPRATYSGSDFSPGASSMLASAPGPDEAAEELAALRAGLMEARDAQEAEASMAALCRSQSLRSLSEASEEEAMLRQELAATRLAHQAAASSELEANAQAEAARQAEVSCFLEAEESQAEAASLRQELTATREEHQAIACSQLEAELEAEESQAQAFALRQQLDASELLCDPLTRTLTRERACQAEDSKEGQESPGDLAGARRKPSTSSQAEEGKKGHESLGHLAVSRRKPSTCSEASSNSSQQHRSYEGEEELESLAWECQVIKRQSEAMEMRLEMHARAAAAALADASTELPQECNTQLADEVGTALAEERRRSNTLALELELMRLRAQELQDCTQESAAAFFPAFFCCGRVRHHRQKQFALRATVRKADLGGLEDEK